MEKYLLGIDVGTSSCKVAVFDDVGKVIAQASEYYPVYYPKHGWAEQDPLDWWEAICACTKRIFVEGLVKAQDIAGIGIDGQSWSAILAQLKTR